MENLNWEIENRKKNFMGMLKNTTSEGRIHWKDVIVYWKLQKVLVVFFFKIKEINKPLQNWSRKQENKIQFTNIRNEREAVTTDPTAIKRGIRE